MNGNFNVFRAGIVSRHCKRVATYQAECPIHRYLRRFRFERASIRTIKLLDKSPRKIIAAQIYWRLVWFYEIWRSNYYLYFLTHTHKVCSSIKGSKLKLKKIYIYFHTWSGICTRTLQRKPASHNFMLYNFKVKVYVQMVRVFIFIPSQGWSSEVQAAFVFVDLRSAHLRFPLLGIF